MKISENNKKNKSNKCSEDMKTKKTSNVIKKSKRNYQRFQYTEESLREAIEKVRNKVLSANKASMLYKIPKGTLINKLHENVPTIRKMGPPTVLSCEEENRIKQWIIDKACIGYPMHPNIVKNAIKNVLDKAPRSNCFKNNMPGQKWFTLFLKRHPEIGLKHAEVLSRSRASVTEENIRQWFAELRAYLEKENASDILSNSSRIYNMDETGMQLCPKTGKLLGARNEKNMYVLSPGQEKENITVLCTYSADGRGIYPMIVYPYKKFPPKEVAASVPSGYIIGHSPKGWMTTETFYNFITNGFYKQLVNDNIEFPVLLLFDGHKSHISLQLHDFCVANHILLYCLYPNATHIMQPCDVGIFRPLKKCWQKQVAEHIQVSNKPITKANFAPIFNAAYVQACDPEVIKKSFECCGLYPFNPDRIDYSKCISYRRKLMKKSNTLQVAEEDTTLRDVVLLNIESNMSQDILHQFEIAYQLNELPQTEIVLFNMWKKFKDASLNKAVNNMLENISKNSTLNKNQSSTIRKENYCDKHFSNNEMPILDVTQNVLIENNVIKNIQDLSSYEDNTRLLSVTTSLNEVKSKNLLIENELDSGLKYSVANSEDLVNIVVLDLTDEEYSLLKNNENQKHMVDSDTDIKKLVHLSTEKDYCEKSLLESSLQKESTINEIIKESSQKIVDVNELWKQELHFPHIETSKKKKINTQPKIYAISSEEWKKLHEEKITKEEEQQRRKELRKFEREIKKKIKQEEQEAKKKEIAVKKELRLKQQAKMEIKKKEKQAKRELLLKRKAESMNLEKHGANVSYKRKVLKNITNSDITNNTITETKEKTE